MSSVLGLNARPHTAKVLPASVAVVMALDQLEQLVLLALVDGLHRFEDLRAVAVLLRGALQRLHVLGEARTAVAGARIDEAVADARIRTDAVAHISMSAPTRSAMFAISFMKLILVASIALAAYLVSSAERTSIATMRSWLRLNGAYRRLSCSIADALLAPMTMRSGRMQSLTASPSFRNSGLEATSNAISAPRAASSAAIAARTLSAVPTGTVDLLTTTAARARCWPMVRATASTYLQVGAAVLVRRRAHGNEDRCRRARSRRRRRW